MNYASTANIEEVMKFYILGDKAFETDFSIYSDSNNMFRLQKVVNRELRKVRKWLEANRLALNVSKTNFVIFHSPANKINEFIKIKVGTKPISQVEQVKYLGILVDCTLRWKPHITKNLQELAVFFL